MDDQENGCSQAGMGLLEANMKMERSGTSCKGSEGPIGLLPLTADAVYTLPMPGTPAGLCVPLTDLTTQWACRKSHS